MAIDVPLFNHIINQVSLNVTPYVYSHMCCHLNDTKSLVCTSQFRFVRPPFCLIHNRNLAQVDLILLANRMIELSKWYIINPLSLSCYLFDSKQCK